MGSNNALNCPRRGGIMNEMKDYRNNLRQVGIVLIVLGLLDIGVMIYCIAKSISYSSSFNIFAVIAGIFLYRGGPKTARTVGFFSAFFIGGFSSMILFFLFTTPLDLLWLQVKLEPGSFLELYLIVFLMLSVLFWVYNRLTQPEVLEAIREALGKPTSKFRTPRAGFFYGVALMVFLAVVLALVSQGQMKEKAIGMAKKQVGPNYKFHISGFSMHSSGGTSHYDVDVTAYNDHEIKDVPLEWDE
jgi:hypothetical protein